MCEPDEHRNGHLGALSGAEIDLWDSHLDDLLHLVVTEIRDCGGPALDESELRCQIMLYAAVMGVAWLLDIPALIRARFGESARGFTRMHPAIKDDESVRAPLLMLTNVLNLWDTQRFGYLLDTVLGW